MKLEELFEAPQNTFPQEFGLDEYEENIQRGKELLAEKNKIALEQLGEYTLWEFKRKYALIRNEDSYIAYFMQFQFDMVPVINRKAVRQIIVWRGNVTKYTQGLPTKIFREYLLDRYGTVITDMEQTADGKRFWSDRILQILNDPRYKIYYLNYIHPRETIEITSSKQFEEILRNKPAYGDELKYQHRRFILTNKPL